MMRLLGDLPIRTKLLIMGMLASGAALVLACAAFVASEQVTLRRQIVRNLSTQAKILGANSAPAIVFRDPDAASQTLAALAAEPNVQAASIVTEDGEPFASYRREPGAVPPEPLVDPVMRTRHAFQRDAVVLSQRIELDGRTVGTVTIRSDLREVRDRVGTGLLVGTSVLGFSLLVALLISTWLARSIARPILDLVELTHRVAEEKDYTIRPTGAGQDEVGMLVGSVSRMLDEIHARDLALESVRAELERRNVRLEQEIIERRSAEQQLELRAHELARSNADLEQFAYVASHDLREPLRMVSGYVQLIAEEVGDKLGPDAHDYVGFALDGTQRMDALIQALLSYSRVGSRGMRLERVSPETVLKDVLGDLRKAQEESGAVVTHGPLPTITADVTQIRQLFQNLLANAMKFRGEAPLEIHVSAQESAAEWQFAVRDNGIGIDPRHAEKIFVLFQRLHTREAYPGTGIGLAVCKRIVERHRGRIWVESEPGKGSTFRFTLAKDPQATGT